MEITICDTHLYFHFEDENWWELWATKWKITQTLEKNGFRT